MSSSLDSHSPPEYEPFTDEHEHEHEHEHEPYTDDPSTPSQLLPQTLHRVTYRSSPPPKYCDNPTPPSPPVQIPLLPYHDLPSPADQARRIACPTLANEDAPPSYHASVGASYPNTLISRIPPAYYEAQQQDEESMVYGAEIGSLSMTVEEWFARVIVIGVVIGVAFVVAVAAMNGYLW